MAHNHHSQCNFCSHEHHHEHDDHEHHHEHDSFKKSFLLIAITTVLLVAAVLIEKTCYLATWQLLLIYLAPYLLIGNKQEVLAHLQDKILHVSNNLFP